MFNLRIEVNVNAQTDKQRAATAPTVTPRRKASSVRSTKAVRELRATVAQIDTLLPALADKPAKQADLLIEKSATIKSLIALESEERDALESIVTLLTATLAEDARAEAAVRVSQSCNSPRAVESFCRLVNVDYGALTRYTGHLSQASH